MKKLLFFMLTALFPFLGQAETGPDKNALKFSVNIPLVLEVTSNIHPRAVRGLAVQTLSLRSNHRTTCVTLNARGYTGIWQSTTSDKIWSIATTSLGHRYCTTTRGNLVLNVAHDFSEQVNYWPIDVLVTTKP